MRGLRSRRVHAAEKSRAVHPCGALVLGAWCCSLVCARKGVALWRQKVRKSKGKSSVRRGGRRACDNRRQGSEEAPRSLLRTAVPRNVTR
jgi:hypothetical protein